MKYKKTLLGNQVSFHSFNSERGNRVKLDANKNPLKRSQRNEFRHSTRLTTTYTAINMLIVIEFELLRRPLKTKSKRNDSKDSPSKPRPQ